MKDTIDNETKCLVYALNLVNSEYKSQIQHILNQLHQFEIDSTMTLNSKSNLNTNANSNANENASLKINVDSEIKNTQVEQNDQKKQTIIKSRIEKSIDAKTKKIQAHLDTKLN